MLQTLFFIPREIFGIPVFGIGWALLIWCCLSGVLLARHYRKSGFSDEFKGLLPVLGLFALAIVFVFPRIEQEQGLPIRGYGTMVLIAVVVGLFDATGRARRAGIRPDVIFSLAFWMFISGIIGARAFFVVQKWNQFQSTDMVAMIGEIANLTQGGLVVYGSLVGGIAGGIVFAIRHRMPIFVLGDVIAPSLVLGLAIGRIGCLMNGCCYGGLCHEPWSITFPRYSAYTQEETPPYNHQHATGVFHGIRIGSDSKGGAVVKSFDASMWPSQSNRPRVGDRIVAINGHPVDSAFQAHQQLALADTRLVLTTHENRRLVVTLDQLPSRSRPVHPTQIYSSVNALLIFFFLVAYYPFRRRDGEVIALTLTIYPITRGLLEIIRDDELSIFGTGLTISQNVSILILIPMVGVWVYVLRSKKRAIKSPNHLISRDVAEGKAS